MQLDPFEFLREWNIKPEDLVRFAPPVGDEECLALMGSIAEGLANEESDVDLLYIGSGDLKDKIVMQIDTSRKTGVSHDEHGREINIEQLEIDQLSDMEARVEGSLEIFQNLKKGRGIVVENNLDTLRMLHRIKTAIPLVNADVLASWQARLRVKEFHQFVCLSHVQYLMNLREDIVGEIEAGNIGSAVWSARCLYGPRLVAALLASIGETNAHVKWHYRLFKRNADVLGEERVKEVLGFIELPVEVLRHDLLERLNAVTEPALREIYGRERMVGKAALAFSLGVRYTNPATAHRWKREDARGEPAGG